MITHRPRFLATATYIREVITSKTGPKTTTANDQGLTLIECLVAIIMVGLVASAIAPALVISVATRVQSQKAEQALELAQSEIDRIRLTVERGQFTADELPLAVEIDNINAISDVAGPNFSSFAERPTPTQTRPVDINGDGSNNFAIQIFRSEGLALGDSPVAFAVGVRVYDFDSVDSDGAGNLLREPASLRIVSGEGERGQRPLAALYTTVAVSEAADSLCNYISYLSDDADLPTGCDVVVPSDE